MMMLLSAWQAGPGFGTGWVLVVAIAFLSVSRERSDQLGGNELGVKTVLLQQFLVIPLLDQMAIIQDHDAVGVPDG